MTKRPNGTRNMILCAFFAALTAICSQLNIPLPFSPIPINPATLCVLCSGAVLGPYAGAVSQLVYLLTGITGLPVFSRMQGGIAILTEATGGYLFAYPVASFISGLIVKKNENRLSCYIFALTAGTVVCYLSGTLWYMFLTNTPPYAALAQCVLPFFPGDLIKIITGSIFCKKINTTLARI